MTGPDYPTVQDYVGWAESKGCTVRRVPVERDGQGYQAVTLQAPSGATAIEIVLEMADPLMSTTIARLDRRLGIKSHLFR